jgi:hypothetical protein
LIGHAVFSAVLGADEQARFQAFDLGRIVLVGPYLEVFHKDGSRRKPPVSLLAEDDVLGGAVVASIVRQGNPTSLGGAV